MRTKTEKGLASLLGLLSTDLPWRCLVKVEGTQLWRTRESKAACAAKARATQQNVILVVEFFFSYLKSQSFFFTY